MANQENNTVSAVNATAQIVSSYLLNHKASMDEVEQLIERVHRKLQEIDLGSSETKSVSATAAPVPNVDVDASITPDYIICLEDGKKLKMLKRYLKTNFDMTPEDYRKRWGLPATYPMVAPNYAEKRSKLAKEIGLGRKAGSVQRSKRAAAETTAPQAKRGLASPKGELPKGKGKLRVTKTSDVMKASVR